jgi:hypothetical protein
MIGHLVTAERRCTLSYPSGVASEWVAGRGQVGSALKEAFLVCDENFLSQLDPNVTLDEAKVGARRPDGAVPASLKVPSIGRATGTRGRVPSWPSCVDDRSTWHTRVSANWSSVGKTSPPLRDLSS